MVCGAPAQNELGVRLRYPPNRDAVWAPDCRAYLCKKHAEGGGALKIFFYPGDKGRLNLEVTCDGSVIRRRKITIKKSAL